MARSGVGTLHLFDCDSLSPANIARHQGDLRDLGRNKASVVRDRIQHVNPTLGVHAYAYNVVEDSEGISLLENLAAESDLLICATDTDDSRMLVNDLAARLKVKSLQIGLHERAASGIVHLYDPDDKQACFACHRRRILSESGKRAEGVAYSEVRDVRELTIQPGLAAQIDLVAQIGALRAIEALMGEASLPSLSIVYVDERTETTREEDCANSEIGESAAMGDLPPRRLRLRIVHLDLERVDTCPVCGRAEDGEGEENRARFSADGDVENEWVKDPWEGEPERNAVQ
jgi:molybdopterin/thiamine biosynthesis adenylyltransferase